MTVEELIESLRRLDPRSRVVFTEDHPNRIVRGVEIVDVYEAKGTDIGEREEFLRLFRLGGPGAKVEYERVVVLDDKGPRERE